MAHSTKASMNSEYSIGYDLKISQIAPSYVQSYCNTVTTAVNPMPSQPISPSMFIEISLGRKMSNIGNIIIDANCSKGIISMLLS
jgi:hypothetical protein